MRVAHPVPFAGAAFAVLHQTREFILNVHACPSLPLSCGWPFCVLVKKSRLRTSREFYKYFLSEVSRVLIKSFPIKIYPNSQRLKLHAYYSLSLSFSLLILHSRKI